MSRVRDRLLVRGVVQGVGFRPFVYRAATARGLVGSVCNRGDAGVEIWVEGEEAAVESFTQELRTRPPKLAAISSVDVRRFAPIGETDFTIASSIEDVGAGGAIPPDTAICDACVADVRGSGRYAGY